MSDETIVNEQESSEQTETAETQNEDETTQSPAEETASDSDITSDPLAVDSNDPNETKVPAEPITEFTTPADAFAHLGKFVKVGRETVMLHSINKDGWVEAPQGFLRKFNEVTPI